MRNKDLVHSGVCGYLVSPVVLVKTVFSPTYILGTFAKNRMTEPMTGLLGFVFTLFYPFRLHMCFCASPVLFAVAVAL